jgi:hypothetical protein
MKIAKEAKFVRITVVLLRSGIDLQFLILSQKRKQDSLAKQKKIWEGFVIVWMTLKMMTNKANYLRESTII